MTDPWMDGARPQSTRAQRARMALVLLIALALPALIIIGGSRRPAETTVDVAAPLTSLVAATDPSTTEAPPSSEVTEAARWTTVPEATSEDPTTSATAAATSSTAPSTTSTTAKPKATSTTTAAPSTTKAPVVAAVQAVAPTSAPSTTAAPTTTRPVVVATSPPAGTQSEAAFLACVRQRESGGNYGAVSPGGTYMGAYQFSQSTWDGTARMAGRGDLVGMKPNLASPADQDQMAITLYRSAGAAPWGGHCP